MVGALPDDPVGDRAEEVHEIPAGAAEAHQLFHRVSAL